MLFTIWAIKYMEGDLLDLDRNINLQVNEIIDYLHDRQLLVVNPKRKNGLILYKRYHAEFAGPGAIVGGLFDTDVEAIIPVGKISAIAPQTSQERISGYLIRRQWVRLIKQITDNPSSLERAQSILNQFENWFDAQTAEQLPDRAFASLVGVLPQTIAQARIATECLQGINLN